MAVDLFAAQNQPIDLYAGTEHAPKPQEQAPEEPSTLSKIAGYGMAAAGGYAKGAANIIEHVVDTPAAVLKGTGAISPQAAERWYKATKESTDTIRPGLSYRDNSPNFTTDAEDAHPLVSKAAELVPEIYATLKSGKGIMEAGSFVGGLGGAATRAVGSGALNSIIADNDHKGSGFLTGIAGSAAADLAAEGLTWAMGSKDRINTAYDAIKKIPFTTEDQAKSYSLAQKIKDYTSTNENLLMPQQQKILNATADRLENINDHSGVLKAMQSLGKRFKQFSGSNIIDDSVYDTYKGFKGAMADIMSSAADNAGIANPVKNAAATYLKEFGRYNPSKGLQNMVGGILGAGVGGAATQAIEREKFNPYTSALGAAGGLVLGSYGAHQLRSLLSSGAAPQLLQQLGISGSAALISLLQNNSSK